MNPVHPLEGAAAPVAFVSILHHLIDDDLRVVVPLLGPLAEFARPVEERGDARDAIRPEEGELQRPGRVEREVVARREEDDPLAIGLGVLFILLSVPLFRLGRRLRRVALVTSAGAVKIELGPFRNDEGAGARPGAMRSDRAPAPEPAQSVIVRPSSNPSSATILSTTGSDSHSGIPLV